MIDRKKILIVEDEMIIALHNSRIVERLGHEVAGRTASGEDAVKKALEIKPDLILMDISLSGKMNGVEAAIKIKESMDIPIIFLSSNSDSTAVSQANKTVPYGFLVKPASESDINTMISAIFGPGA